MADRITHQYGDRVEEEENRLHKYEASPSLTEAANLHDQVERYEDGFRERALTYFIIQHSRIKNSLVAAITSASGEVSMFKRDNNAIFPITMNDYQALSCGPVDIQQFMPA